ncbi:class I SAM-dependent methyltransferase [Qipengyuania gaetbuli]|uniref:class I SAM-dependent methyltransferase n=1 Tax=Qipengyuania gaetbuli TaxID=266952 RepID=UPI001C99E9C6|nr:class I SAM-dependent methyltransferase [Qipengyuania gaetbuli]MBY6014399.1 class I SAM-dependent methyltransferase [Qipengyuania gaetbuli]
MTSSTEFINRSEIDLPIEVRQCKVCGHATTYPPMPDVRALYGERSSQDYQPDIRNNLSRQIKDWAFKRQVKKLLRQLPRPGQRLLDFGCGSGQFTRVLSESLPHTFVVGSDFFDTPPPELNGHNYMTADDVALQSGTFDTVMAMHVLEHDDDTEALLAKILKPAKPGAYIVIEVPNVECVWTKVFGRFWDAWYLPFHRHHFSMRSLAAALSGAGLEILNTYQITAPTMGRTFANIFGKKNNLFWLGLGIVLHPVQWLGEKVSGRATAIRVIARKPAE